MHTPPCSQTAALWLAAIIAVVLLALLVTCYRANAQLQRRKRRIDPKAQRMAGAAPSSSLWSQLGAECLEALPAFNPWPWNRPETEMFNNCLAYAFQDLQRNRTQKPQPGELARLPPLSARDYTCPNLQSYLKADHPGIYFAGNSPDPCACGYYKAFLCIDTTLGQRDYHFARQDNDGTWSHKPGSTPATDLDGNGQTIADPLQANWNIGGHRYDTSCGFFCIPAPNRPIPPFHEMSKDQQPGLLETIQHTNDTDPR